MVQRENIVETHLKITGLEYDAEYEVKLSFPPHIVLSLLLEFEKKSKSW